MPVPAKKATRLLAATSLAALSFLAAPLALTDAASAQNDRPGDAPRRPPVRQEDLGPPSGVPQGQAVGVLGPDRGGLGANLWRGSSRPAVVALLQRMPAAAHSRVLRDLARRLLLTAAVPPAGDDDKDTGLLTLRLQRLYAMAALDGLAALYQAASKNDLRAAPKSPRNPVRLRTAISGLLLEGRAEPACAAVDAALNGPITPFLERASIVCHVRNGRTERATMALGLLREAGQKIDPVLAALISAAANQGPAPPRLDRPTALQVALLPTGSFPLPEMDVAAMPLPLLRGVVVSGKPPRTRRIAAAERLAAADALPDGLLAALYAGADVPAAAVRSAREIRLRDYGRDARIRLYQAAALETNPEQRMLTLAAWWRLARAAGDEPLTARLTAPLLKNIRPGRRWQDYAGHIARVYFWTGRLRRGLDWYRVLKGQPFRNPDDYYRLTAAAALADPVVVDIDDLRGWRDYQRRHGDAVARAARFHALLSGLNEAPDALADWRDTAVSPQPAGPAAADWRSIEAAAGDGRRGETVLRVVAALAPAGLAKAPPAALTAAVSALRRVGLDRDARALAVEAALQAGL